jgi:carbamoyltransferase
VAYAYVQYGGENLCLSGGVALNCVANGRIVREGPFKNVYIFPAAGDAGGSVGAALYVQSVLKPESHLSTAVETIYLGPKFSDSTIENFLQESGIKYYKLDSDRDRSQRIGELLQANKVIGLFQGRMEFGPRALGNRSIIADPRQSENWKRVNIKIKFREDFRPFAPSVMADKADEIFDLNGVPSPYMLLTAGTKVTDLPAITHVNNSARIQTVSPANNKPYYDILSAFKEKTGCGVVINTSFNVRGEPIVCDHIDAFKCFIRTDMDILVLEDFIIKADNLDKEAFKQQFELEVFGDD